MKLPSVVDVSVLAVRRRKDRGTVLPKAALPADPRANGAAVGLYAKLALGRADDVTSVPLDTDARRSRARFFVDLAAGGRNVLSVKVKWKRSALAKAAVVGYAGVPLEAVLLRRSTGAPRGAGAPPVKRWFALHKAKGGRGGPAGAGVLLELRVLRRGFTRRREFTGDVRSFDVLAPVGIFAQKHFFGSSALHCHSGSSFSAVSVSWQAPQRARARAAAAAAPRARVGAARAGAARRGAQNGRAPRAARAQGAAQGARQGGQGGR